MVNLFSFLWDCGFDVGHSVRSLEECERKVNKTLLLPPICLSLVIYRGDVSLFNALDEILKKPDFWAVNYSLMLKFKEQIERYQRYHNTSYNLEPDLKYSPGGLRIFIFYIDRITPYRERPLMAF